MFIHLYILTIILKYGMSSYYKKGHWSYVVNAWKQNFLCRFYKRKLKKHLHSVLSTIKFRFLGLWFNVRWWDTDTRDLREENASYMNVCLNIYGCQFLLVVNYWNCSAVYSVTTGSVRAMRIFWCWMLVSSRLTVTFTLSNMWKVCCSTFRVGPYTHTQHIYKHVKGEPNKYQKRNDSNINCTSSSKTRFGLLLSLLSKNTVPSNPNFGMSTMIAFFLTNRTYPSSLMIPRLLKNNCNKTYLD